MRYGKTGLIAIVAASTLLVAAAPLAAKKASKPRPTTVTFAPTPVLSGSVASKGPCKSNRSVQVINSTTGAVLASTTTHPSGFFSTAFSSFGGKAFAKVSKAVIKKKGKKKVTCGAVKSRPQQLGSANLDVNPGGALANLGIGAGYEFALDVVNTGPSQALDVVLTSSALSPGSARFIPPSNPAVCSPSGAGASCALGTLAPGETRKLRITFGPCPTGSMMLIVNSAASSTPDPNPVNNSDAPGQSVPACA